VTGSAPRTDVAVAVLAAGRGSRFGRGARNPAVPKLLAPLGGRPLVSWALEAATGSGLRPVVLVVGHDGRRVAAVATEGVIVSRARGWRRGLAHSLRAALDALEGRPGVGAVCIGLGDQPRVGAAAHRRLAEAFGAGATFAVATYGGRRANPVLLARSLWPAARALRDDEGARALMGVHRVTEVPCDGTGDPVDVDTPEDLADLAATAEDVEETDERKAR
jgi:CTP:molybdopterin cytidylyltransferase MocA